MVLVWAKIINICVLCGDNKQKYVCGFVVKCIYVHFFVRVPLKMDVSSLRKGVPQLIYDFSQSEMRGCFRVINSWIFPLSVEKRAQIA